MTTEERQELRSFESKIRKLIDKYQVLAKENADLYAELESKEQEISQLKDEVKLHKRNYETMRLAKMIEVSDTDVKESRQRITNLVREVNRCIALLCTESGD